MVLSLTWVLGTMSVVGISLNSITGMITSLTIGLGVAYSIHVTQRYHQQLDRSESVWAALRTTVTGTGGALLGSAATTAGGFGVLMFSFVTSLQQSGSSRPSRLSTPSSRACWCCRRCWSSGLDFSVLTGPARSYGASPDS